MNNLRLKFQKIRSRFQSLKSWLLANPFQTALIFIFITWWAIGTALYFLERNVEGKNIATFEDGIWWGIVTLATVGYGDKFPITTTGRILATFLIVSGVVGIAIVTAKISSYFLERALRERRGIVDSSLLKNHFVICGWKPEMATFLLAILESNPKIRDEEIVLINNAPDSDLESLLEIPRLKKVKVIRGDFFIEVNLRRGAPERAQKILILADATPNAQGRIPTITEADARTIMTAMTLSNIAKGVSVVAEILDSGMDQYLRIAHVNEIIYSRDYSRLLLAMASTGTGVTNIFHDLLDPHSPFFLKTKEIPEGLLDKTYSQLKEVFEKSRGSEVLLGILENSGNSHFAKEKALRLAQQTANISQLVQNLQSVKALRFNRPLFGPSGDYVIREGSMAIVIERHGEKDG